MTSSFGAHSARRHDTTNERRNDMKIKTKVKAGPRDCGGGGGVPTGGGQIPIGN
jgi:hypothetical protein